MNFHLSYYLERAVQIIEKSITNNIVWMMVFAAGPCFVAFKPLENLCNTYDTKDGYMNGLTSKSQ